MTARLHDWVLLQEQLLRQERDEEIAQQSDRLAGEQSEEGAAVAGSKRGRGTAVFPLSVAETSIGCFGRTVCCLQRYGGKAVCKEGESFPRLPTNRISSGDVVVLRPVNSKRRAPSTSAAAAGASDSDTSFPSGVVKRVRDHSISVIFEAVAEAEHEDIFRGNPGPLRLDVLGTEVTFKPDGGDKTARYDCRKREPSRHV